MFLNLLNSRKNSNVMQVFINTMQVFLRIFCDGLLNRKHGQKLF